MDDTARHAATSRILVIDDEESVRTTLRHMLEDADFEVLEARDGNRIQMFG